MREDAERAGKDGCMEKRVEGRYRWAWPSRKKRGEGGAKEGVARTKACRIHKHLSNTAADSKIGGPGAKDLSVALANCPNLHTLDLSRQWVASCLSWGRWEAGFG